ncbi:helix-turn-helix domain-containing protein [Rhodospirillaceae bacterium SYSU D60014]|uniref:helix-turn-helix domain-containing protein n=1 Tax=Virgifigura deserti TaxID=2268457 RepID=UPI0013C52CD1
MVSPAEELRRDSHFDPERYDPAAGGTVGDLLRRTREGFGQDIDAVAMQLRIRNNYLRAIETGRFRDLPGSTYAVGFVRTYAEYLGLDAQEVLRRFREEAAEVSGQTQLIFPAAATEGKFPGGAILLLSVLLAGIAYGAWYYLSDQRANVLDLIPAVPEQIMGLVSGNLAPAGGAADPSISGTVESEAAEPQAAEAQAVAEAREPEAADDDVAVAEPPAVVDEASSEAAPSSEPEPQLEVESQAAASAPPPAPASGANEAETETTVAAIPAAPAAPVAEPDPQVFGSANTEFRIVLRARLESWVQVTDAADRILLTRVLRVGDRYQVPDRPGLTLATGNAGGLDIVVDGRAMPPLGPVGVVRRDILLDPERLVSGTALQR